MYGGVVHHETFKDIPKILETPFVGEDKKNKRPPYKHEIEMLKKQQFDADLKNKITVYSLIILFFKSASNCCFFNISISCLYGGRLFFLSSPTNGVSKIFA